MSNSTRVSEMLHSALAASGMRVETGTRMPTGYLSTCRFRVPDATSPGELLSVVRPACMDSADGVAYCVAVVNGSEVHFTIIQRGQYELGASDGHYYMRRTDECGAA